MFSPKSFSFNYKDLVINEIALDGLNGIGLELLWKRIETCISSQVTEKLKDRLWKFVVADDSITFYILQYPVAKFEVLDRFSIVDENTGQLLDPPDYVDGPYEYCPIENEYGSSGNYKIRILLPKSVIESLSYQDLVTKYGDKLIMVASLEERWRALVSHLPITYLTMLTPIHYCIIELIGKARENGQMTVGKTNLTKIVNESKFLFYNRKHLQQLDLIRVQYVTQVVGGKLMKVILLRLKKFHKPNLQSLPKVGRIRDMVTYLLDKPDFSERNELMIKQGFMTPQQSKRLQKTFNIFTFEDKLVTIEESPTVKTSKQKPTLKKKCMRLNPVSDDDSQSDEDVQNTPLKCQYKVGVSLLRQAYERFLDAGLKGLTQIEIAQLLGVEFYTGRSICRIFKARNIIREFLEDKGRQRTARFVAIAATKEMDKKYADEKRKFFEFYDDSKTTIENNLKRAAQKTLKEDCTIPNKKAKVIKDNQDTFESAVTETHSLDGIDVECGSLINAKKNPTLRQLKFANGILKVLKEKKFVIGLQTLSSLVSKETEQPAMDTKAMKKFIQKLVTDGQIKLLKLKWPGPDNKFSNLICAAHLKATDPIIKAKYKEICLKAERNKKKNAKNIQEVITRPLSEYTYPRYMKIQKLHQHVMNMVYFNNIKSEDFPTGFTTMFTIIPEMTVEFALGNINYVEVHEIPKFVVDNDFLELKLKDAPSTVTKGIIESKSLQNSIRRSLKILALLGLIQIIENPTSYITKNENVLYYVFYVNRHAKILDTTGKWPRDDDMKSLEKSFAFESPADVENFWGVVSTISCNTVINAGGRERYKLDLPMRDEHAVTEFDNGERFGDGLGPCGYDSSIFMDAPRLWTTFLSRIVKKAKKPPVKHAKKKKSLPKKANPTKPKPSKAKSKLHTVKVEENNPTNVITQRKKIQETHSISWSKFEDRILMMCKVAITIISPIPQPGCLRIRNIVAKDLLTLLDPEKTASTCHRRATYLDSNSLFNHERDCIISEMRRHHTIVGKYEGLLKKLKMLHYVNINRLINEARLPMLELIWIIMQMEKNRTFVKQKSCIARNYEDFNRKYTVTLTSAASDVNLYKTSSSNELEYGALKEGIVMAVMLSCENELTKDASKRIYTIFKRYSEPVLRNSIDELRKGGAIVPREKMLNYQANTVYFDNLVQSAFKMSAFYRRKWLNRLQGDFYNDLSKIMHTEVPTSGLKGNPDLNCLLFEMNTCDALDIVSDTVPIVTGSAGSIIQEEAMNVIDMETKYKLKSGLMGWKNKKNLKVFSELFEKVDHVSILNKIASESIVVLKTEDNIGRSNEIVSYLEDMGFKGCTFKELKQHLSVDEKILIEKLSELETCGIIKRIGYFQNKIMLKKYTKPYLLEISKNKYLIPTPWMSLTGEIRQDVFFKWANVVMNKVFESPGCSIAYLCDNFECISSRSLQDICGFLEKCKCVTLKTMEKYDTDLFSDDDAIMEIKDYNPYEFIENIYVFPVENSLTRYASMKKTMLSEELDISSEEQQ